MSGEDVAMLLNVLDMGDLELRFHDGSSIKAHSQKLQIASIGGVLQNLIEDVLDDQITGSKRKRLDPGTVYHPPVLKVSPLAPMHMQALAMDQCIHLHPMHHDNDRVQILLTSFIRACTQVEGEYEDWMEVLRLIYHSGAF